MVKGLDLPEAVIIAQGGGHPADMIPLLKRSEDVLHPDCYEEIETVTLCVGTNPLNVSRNRYIPMSDIIFDYNRLIRDIKLLFPNAKLGLFNVMPRAYSHSDTYWRINDFNMFLRDHVAPSYANTYWIRLYDIFVTPYNQLKRELFGKTLLHLSPLGKGLMANTIICFQHGMLSGDRYYY